MPSSSPAAARPQPGTGENRRRPALREDIDVVWRDAAKRERFVAALVAFRRSPLWRRVVGLHGGGFNVDPDTAGPDCDDVGGDPATARAWNATLLAKAQLFATEQRARIIANGDGGAAPDGRPSSSSSSSSAPSSASSASKDQKDEDEASSGGASLPHAGPAMSFCAHHIVTFPLWHRAYILEFEACLQLFDPERDRVEAGDAAPLGLPYWRWDGDRSGRQPTLPDAARQKSVSVGGVAVNNPLSCGLQQPSDDDAVGRCHGETERDPGANDSEHDWAAEWAQYDQEFYQRLYRQRFVRFATSKSYCGTPSTTSIEQPHDSVHDWVGGDMGVVARSSWDPLFWLHHCNVERLFCEFQEAELRRTGGDIARSGLTEADRRWKLYPFATLDAIPHQRAWMASPQLRSAGSDDPTEIAGHTGTVANFYDYCRVRELATFDSLVDGAAACRLVRAVRETSDRLATERCGRATRAMASLQAEASASGEAPPTSVTLDAAGDAAAKRAVLLLAVRRPVEAASGTLVVRINGSVVGRRSVFAGSRRTCPTCSASAVLEIALDVTGALAGCAEGPTEVPCDVTVEFRPLRTRSSDGSTSGAITIPRCDFKAAMHRVADEILSDDEAD